MSDFFSDERNNSNTFEYNLDELGKTDDSIQYSETLIIQPGLKTIRGIAVDNDDHIYITGDGGVEIYTPDGEPYHNFETETNSSCIAVDNDKNIFLGIVDGIEVRNSTGNLTGKWDSFNEKTVITSIALQDTGVFISDAGNKIVYKYNYGGDLIQEIGEKDSIAGIQGFVIPSPYFDVAVGRDREIWAVNSGRHQLEAYSPDGRLISSWKKSSMRPEGFSGCCNPSHIAIMSDGAFVTSEKGIVRIKIHEPSGKYRCMVAESDQFEKGTKGLDLAVDSKDRIIVLDPVRNLIRLFELNENQNE